MRFSTYGPFDYAEQSPTATVALFDEIEAARTCLEHGVGIYVFTAKNQNGNSYPLYVGKSTRSDFGGRIVGHLNKGKFVETIKSCNGISIFLLAALDDSGELKKKRTLSDTEADYIGRVEYGFIGSAVSQNAKLLNIHGKGSEAFVSTQGLLDDTDPFGAASANELRLILGIK